MQKEDMRGRRFGRLLVIASAIPKEKQTYWLCRCDCGKEKEVMRTSLILGRAQSCGCLRSELLSQRSPESRMGKQTHGQYKTPEYAVWLAMKNRCLNPKYFRYQDWGGRGIQVCTRWKDSFEDFLTDMGKRPGKGYSIERVDNNKGYEKSNCKWATFEEQSSNKRPRQHDPKYDLTGRRFGRLVVTGLAYRKDGGSYWLCQCDCGNTKQVFRTNLLNGTTRSCTCLQRQLSADRLRHA